MKTSHLSLFACALAAAGAVHGQQSTSADYWDISQGAVITADSGTMAGAGSPAGLFGQNGQNNADGSTWTYFPDGLPADFVHFVEWQTPAEVTLGRIRVFAFGDDFFNSGREFDTFTVKAKSPGSDTYDITVVSYTATHPFSFVDPTSYLVVDEVIEPLTARFFRAEFTQFTAGYGWDGPRLLEIDGLPVPRPVVNIPPTSEDVWDISRGAVVTASSAIHPGAGTVTGLLGQNGQNYFDGATLTYFADGQPENFVHYVEWQTPADVTVGGLRLYALGDAHINNGREFAQFTLKAKSPGSSEYDLTVLAVTPTHPYELLDPNHFLVVNQEFTPVTARFFRAEFVQYTAGNGWDGPRIVELDAITGAAPPPPPPPPPVDVPPSFTIQPQSVMANFHMPVALFVQTKATGAANYQWFKNGEALPGEIFNTLWIPALAPEHTGAYSVSVTDNIGTVTSSEATITLDTVNIRPSGFDLWDAQVGSIITGMTPFVGAPHGMFGGGSNAEDSGTTLFADAAPGAQHIVEWATPFPARVSKIRLFANGAGGREFGKFTLRAKSPGSETFDIVVGTFAPTHPYTLVDETTFAILDTEIAAIEASAFRAEFEQVGENGPSVIELDAFSTRPIVAPAIVVNPVSDVVSKGATAKFQVIALGGQLQYQWKRNGIAIPGATTDTLTIASVKKPDEATFTVVVSNPLGSVQSAAATLEVMTKPEKIRPPK